MIHQIKEHFFSIASTTKFHFIIISLLFFFAWSDFIIDNGFRIPHWLLFSGWTLIIGEIIIPIILLIGAILYNHRVAYALTLAIFILTILTNLSSLSYYIAEYNYEKNGGMSTCSCSPEWEIESIVYIVLTCLFAILLMNRKKLLKVFNWKLSYSLKLAVFMLLLYLMILGSLS